jgi:O-antigen ligase
MAKGTFPHPYLLAGWAAMAVGVAFAVAVRTASPWARWASVIVAALGSTALAVTFSRMSVAGLALASPAAGWGALRSRRYRVPAAAVVFGFLTPAALFIGGWSARAGQTTGGSGSGVDALASGRVTFAKQSLELIRDSPLLGVGPGQYAVALADQLQLPHDLLVYPVHNVPLLLAAETGVAGGLAALVVLLALMNGARRTLDAWIALSLYLPFVLLDWPFGQPHGVLVLAMWAGVVAKLNASKPHIPVHPECANCPPRTPVTQ